MKEERGRRKGTQEIELLVMQRLTEGRWKESLTMNMEEDLDMLRKGIVKRKLHMSHFLLYGPGYSTEKNLDFFSVIMVFSSSFNKI